jgi:hypothetical protein
MPFIIVDGTIKRQKIVVWFNGREAKGLVSYKEKCADNL